MFSILTTSPGFEKLPESYRKEYSNATLQFLDGFPKDWPEVEWLTYESAAGIGDIGSDDNFLTFGGVMLTTASKGNMTISSADMLDPPVISPNWLVDDKDLEQAYSVSCSLSHPSLMPRTPVWLLFG